MPGVLDVAVSFPILLQYGKRAYCVDLVWGCQDKNIRFTLKYLKKTFRIRITLPYKGNACYICSAFPFRPLSSQESVHG
jgi:hypothetical protein